jgi:hypothetical protein
MLKNKAGAIGAAKWSFTVSSKVSGTVSAKKKIFWDGSLGYETAYGLEAPKPVNNTAYLPYRPYGVNRGKAEVNGRGETTTLQFKGYVTDEERVDAQPLDRYTLSVQNEEGIVALGYYSPSFSTLSLYNPYYFNGVTLDLRSGPLAEGHTRLMGVWGQTQRRIDGGLDGFSGQPTTGEWGEYLYGTRWEFGDKYFLMGFNTVTVNDKDAPANAGTLQPKYSGLGTVDMAFMVPQIYLKLNGETGADYYFNGGGITAVNAGSAYTAGPIPA